MIQIVDVTDDMLEQMMAEHRRLNPDLPVREDVIESLTDYVCLSRHPGDFLMAVLSNNLFEAMGRADSYNRASLFQICEFIHTKLPYNCHGSPERVRAHLALRKDEA